jgi:hypothetical protein
MSKTRIYIALPQDRDAVVTVLARNGYTVRQGKERKGKTYEKFVEFWKEEDLGKSEEVRGTD